MDVKAIKKLDETLGKMKEVMGSGEIHEGFFNLRKRKKNFNEDEFESDIDTVVDGNGNDVDPDVFGDESDLNMDREEEDDFDIDDAGVNDEPMEKEKFSSTIGSMLLHNENVKNLVNQQVVEPWNNSNSDNFATIKSVDNESGNVFRVEIAYGDSQNIESLLFSYNPDNDSINFEPTSIEEGFVNITEKFNKSFMNLKALV